MTTSHPLRRESDWFGSLPNPQGPRPERREQRIDPLLAEALANTCKQIPTQRKSD